MAEVLLESPRLPQPSTSPFPASPGLCVGGREGQSQEGEPPSSPGTVLLTPYRRDGPSRSYAELVTVFEVIGMIPVSGLSSLLCTSSPLDP